jgi:pre-mRNA-splicing factor ISY1
MARPAEKARAMMNKWVAMRDGGDNRGAKSNRPQRPHLASECEHLADAERFRGQIVREISDKISRIQNPALPEHEIRQLNDEINKLQNTKYHWNKRIYQLGGVDYNAIEKKRRIEEGDAQLHSHYRYYGVAKNLPGVPELLEQQQKKKAKPSDVYKRVDADYYGYRDEDDGVLLELEAKATRRMKVHCKRNGIAVLDVDGDVDFLAVESQQEIERLLLEQKKKALLKKYSL